MSVYRGFSSVYLMTTNRCNLKCKYCYESNREGDMSLEVGRAALDWLSTQDSQRQPRSVTFFGGEPLLMPDLIRGIVKYGVDSGKRIDQATILSNGTICNESIKDLLLYIRKNCRRFVLQVSLDGCKESHDRNRVFNSGEGSFDLIQKNIEEYKKVSPQMIFRQTVVPENVKNLCNDFKMMYDLCGDDGNVSLSTLVEGNWSDENIEIYKEQIIKILNLYRGTKKNSFFNLVHGTLQRLMDYSMKKRRGCGAARSLACITTDGGIYPCHRFVAYKHIKDCKIGNIWDGIDADSESYKKIRGMFGSNKKCNACEVTPCNVCMATNMAMGKGLILDPPAGYCKLMHSANELLEQAAKEFVAKDRIILSEGKILRIGKGGFCKMEDKKNTMFADNEDLIAQGIMTILKQVRELKNDIGSIKSHLKINCKHKDKRPNSDC